MNSEVDVSLSESAVGKIAEILSHEDQRACVRLSIEGGGCSGFQYKYELVEDHCADDLLIEERGARLVIDPLSLEYLHGAEVDFVDALIGESFQVRNPNAVAGCGCGVSFTI